MVAVRFVDETYVVGRGKPFQNTVLPGTKPLPATDKVKSPPMAGMEAGLRELATGNGFKLLALAMLLVNIKIASLEGFWSSTKRAAKPFVPQRTSCVG